MLDFDEIQAYARNLKVPLVDYTVARSASTLLWA